LKVIPELGVLPENGAVQPASQPLGSEGARIHRPTHEHGQQQSPAELAERVRAAGLGLGFARVGFTRVTPLAVGETRFTEWLKNGYQGDLSYLETAARHQPQALLAQARTLIAVALSYRSREVVPLRSHAEGAPLTGVVARYARGEDYHDVTRGKLRRLADAVANLIGRPILARHCVDTAPLLERAAAERAGLGFAGKSTMTIVLGLGTFVTLGELLVDVEIAEDSPIEPRCGACRLCLDACPTGAFVDAFTLDARRCISYWTIENSGAIPRELRPLIGQRVFGCDVCQDVCPFNASSNVREANALPAHERLIAPDLIELLELGSARYRSFVKGTALRRVHREGLARNAAVALGNARDVRAVAPLIRVVAGHKSALVRAHAAWALGEIGPLVGESALECLRCAARHDRTAAVREEAGLALMRLYLAGATDGHSPERDSSP
jgi:epoxyqueuosine reductase